MANLNLLHRFSPLQDETVQLNPDDLRGRLAQRLALLALVVAQFFILFYESGQAFPLPAIGFWLLLTAGCRCPLAFWAQPGWRAICWCGG